MEKIKNFASKADIEMNNLEGNAFWLVNGSTIVDIYVEQLEKNVMVNFFSRVIFNPRVDEELMKKLLELNVNLNFGAFGLSNGVVVFKYSVLGGDNLDYDEFINAITLVAIIADEYDDKIASTHGGMTGVAKLKEEQQKRQETGFSW